MHAISRGIIIIILLLAFYAFFIDYFFAKTHVRYTSNPLPRREKESLNESGSAEDRSKLKKSPGKEKRMQSETCSSDSWEAGNHQKVISYGFMNKEERYWRIFNSTLNSIPERYPGWKVRIYTTRKDLQFLMTKAQLKRNYVFVCDVSDLPPPLGNISAMPPSFWRFAVLGDPQVDDVIFRDADSGILEREVDAVKEWLNISNKTLHLMRDHPKHRSLVMAGLWGIRMDEGNRDLVRAVRDYIFKHSGHEKRNDQPLLSKKLFPFFKKDFIAHDSYQCKRFIGSSPFPTKRKGKLFVGSIGNHELDTKCPASCRPKNHQDWIYC